MRSVSQQKRRPSESTAHLSEFVGPAAQRRSSSSKRRHLRAARVCSELGVPTPCQSWRDRDLRWPSRQPRERPPMSAANKAPPPPQPFTTASTFHRLNLPPHTLHIAGRRASCSCAGQSRRRCAEAASRRSAQRSSPPVRKAQQSTSERHIPAGSRTCLAAIGDRLLVPHLAPLASGGPLVARG